MIRTRAVLANESVLDPLGGTRFSMRTESSFHRQLPRNRSRGGPHSLADVVDDALDERWVVAFGHHADQRLCPRLANDQAAAPLQLGLGGGNALPDAVRLQRLRATVETHVLEQLRKRFELAEQLARGHRPFNECG